MNIKKLVKGGAWFLLFSILAKVIIFFNKIYLTRMLSVKDYGLFVSMFSLMSIIFTFNSFGLSASMVKFIPEFKVKKQYGKITSVITSILQFEIITRIIIFVALWQLSPWLAENYFKIKSPVIFQFFCSLVLSEIISRNVKPFFKSLKKTIILGWVEFLTPLLHGIFFIIFFKFGNTIHVPIISYILTSLIIGIVFGVIALKTHNIFKHKPIEEWATFKRMFAFGLPLIIANTGGIFISHFDTIMLTSLTTLETVGIYNIALSSALLLSFIFSAISVTLIPTVSELNTRNKQRDIYKGLTRLYKYSIIVLVPIIIIGFIFAKQLLNLIYGTEYAIGYIALRILLIGIIFVILNNYNIRVLIGTGNTKAIAKVTWISAGLNIILNIPFIYYFNIVGAAVATSISYGCQYFLTYYQIKKNLGDNIDKR